MPDRPAVCAVLACSHTRQPAQGTRRAPGRNPAAQQRVAGGRSAGLPGPGRDRRGSGRAGGWAHHVAVLRRCPGGRSRLPCGDRGLRSAARGCM